MISPSADVYLNLACEDKLFADYDGEPLLFLWRNHNAIVIGKWQNAWKECNAAEAERDGIKIARRLTGGGAVFHDLNNLNYTFIANEKDYDVLRQCEVVRKALLALGIKAEISGRNDLTANGFKVSGNAFRKARGKGLHHGTLLISCEPEKMAKYLRPSPLKLSSKGVDSVRSRVGSLCMSRPATSVSEVAAALTESFANEYGACSYLTFDEKEYREKAALFGSAEYVFGKNPPYAFSVEFACPYGLAEVAFRVEKGCVRSVKVYSDTLDEELPRKAENILTGARFDISGIHNAFISERDPSLEIFGASLAEALSEKLSV